MPEQVNPLREPTHADLARQIKTLQDEVSEIKKVAQSNAELLAQAKGGMRVLIFVGATIGGLIGVAVTGGWLSR